MNIVEVSITRLASLESISPAFEAVTRFVVDPDGSNGREVPLETPFRKDYDILPDNRPGDWVAQFDTTRWGLLLALDHETPVGAATIACDVPGGEILADHPGQAVLWDLRVCPECRGEGIGSALFDAAVQWVRDRGYRELKIETQDNNPAAVGFYLRHGCRLGNAAPEAYPGLPGETMLLFYLTV